MISNLEICKARDLFIEKGILKRSVISDKIIYSWVRSKLHNISFEIMNKVRIRNSVDLLSINKETSKLISRLRNLNHDKSSLYLIDLDGRIIFESINSSMDLPMFIDFSEETIGTSAPGISLVTGERIRVLGCEHYNSLLTPYISESLPFFKENSMLEAIVVVFTQIEDISIHSQLINQIQKNFLKKEVKNSEITDKRIKNSVKTTVNSVKTVDKSDEKESIIATIKDIEPSYIKECKVFTLSIIEKDTIEQALKYYSWNLKKTSEALGIGRSTLYRKLKEYHIEKVNL